MILPTLLLVGTLSPRENEIAKWVYEKDLTIVETPVDQRASVKGEYKASPPTFTLARMFPETSAFSLFTFRLGDRLTKEFLDLATPTPDEKNPGTTEFEAYAGGLFSSYATYRVGQDNRVKSMSYWGKRFPEDAEVYYDAIHSVLIERLGRPTSTLKKEKEEIPYFIEFWQWSDGAYLSHMVQFADEYCAQFLYLSQSKSDGAGQRTLLAKRLSPARSGLAR